MYGMSKIGWSIPVAAGVEATIPYSISCGMARHDQQAPAKTDNMESVKRNKGKPWTKPTALNPLGQLTRI